MLCPCGESCAVELSTTWTVKLNDPAWVGVPVISPVEELSDSPGGRLPEDIDQVYAGVPLVAWSV